MSAKHIGVFLSVFTVAILFLLVSPISSYGASPTTQGYVKYNVTLTNSTQTRTLTISENVQPSSTSGRSLLTITITGQNSNLTYSHLVNSSRVMFPVIPISSSQSFNYQFNGISFDLTVTKTGTSTTMFNGNSVQLTNYNFQGSISLPAMISSQYGNLMQMRSVQGTLSLLSSDLLYSLQTNLSQDMSLKVQLVSTSIALDAPAQTVSLANQAMLYGSIAAGVVAIGLGGFYVVRRLSHRSTVNPALPADKPSYWVD